MTAKTPCEPDELRTLFLFEALTDEQLETLCANGHIQQLPSRARSASRASRRPASTSSSTGSW